ncbi:EmrB/QacA subfamily drug resistance transporter [Thermocatellispora tengchongensis]|uniref:EmrB/QacA subfamily drug resistance transporter n=1 Tax=Thermocatellispora tengchongensis TaxID=1073253 RepID=A0A840PFB6_9ACTN|nr:MFS transporter [Thermocatellispora tengchongensis]MBB5136150.1 EmrB/QacA subfamily drug resistance transporter [Thermocatellispora tengchongensis]
MPKQRGTGALLALLAFAQFISAVDYNIVYVALPEIGDAVGFDAHSLQWVISAYAVAFGGFLLLGGRAADLLGHRRMFTTALVLYGLSSLAGGLAEDPGPLVAARAVQGLGGALLLPATLSLINTTFAEGAERNRALAAWGGAGAVGLALGSLLGGVLTNYLGWESVFFVNVPLALGATAVAFGVIPKDPPRERGRGFDLAGALTATVGFSALVFGLVQGPEAGWGSAQTLVALAGSALLIGAFLAIEARTAHPLMPLRLFRNRSLVTAMGVTFVFMGTFGSQYYFFTVYLQNAHHYSAMATGLAFLPSALMGMAGSRVSERLLAATGVRNTIVIGLLLGAAGMTLLALAMSPSGGYPALLPGIVAISLGQGIAWTAMFAAAATGVDARHQGIASAMASTTQQIGGAVGLAVLIAVATSGLDTATGPALVPGLRTAGFTAAALTLAGVAIALTLRRPARQTAARPTEAKTPARVP